MSSSKGGITLLSLYLSLSFLTVFRAQSFVERQFPPLSTIIKLTSRVMLLFIFHHSNNTLDIRHLALGYKLLGSS